MEDSLLMTFYYSGRNRRKSSHACRADFAGATVPGGLATEGDEQRSSGAICFQALPSSIVTLETDWLKGKTFLVLKKSCNAWSPLITTHEEHWILRLPCSKIRRSLMGSTMKKVILCLALFLVGVVLWKVISTGTSRSKIVQE